MFILLFLIVAVSILHLCVTGRLLWVVLHPVQPLEKPQVLDFVERSTARLVPQPLATIPRVSGTPHSVGVGRELLRRRLAIRAREKEIT